MRPLAALRVVLLAALVGAFLVPSPGAADDVQRGTLVFPWSMYEHRGMDFKVERILPERVDPSPSYNWYGNSPDGLVRRDYPVGTYRFHLWRGGSYHPELETVTTYYPGVDDPDDAVLVEIKAGETTVLPHFDPLVGAQAIGRVVKDDGSPVAAGTTIQASRDRPQDDRGESFGRAPVASDGTFTVKGLDARSGWTFRVLGPDLTDGYRDIGPFRRSYLGDVDDEVDARRVTTSLTTPMDVGTITLPSNGTMSGTVRDPDGAPLGDVPVRFRYSSAPGTVTDADGRWTIGPVHPGDYTMVTRVGGYLFDNVDVPIEVRLGTNTSADATLPHAQPLFERGPQLLGRGDLIPGVALKLRHGETATVDPGTPLQADAQILGVEWVVERRKIIARGTTFTPEGLTDGLYVRPRVRIERKGIVRLAEVDSIVMDVPFEGNPDTPRTPVVHELLTADSSGIAPDPSKVSWQWLRDGKPISGATGRQYRTTAADQSKKVAVRATASSSGVRTTTLSSRPATVARGGSKTSVSFSATGSGRVSVSGRVNVPRVDGRYVDGKVVLHRLRGGSTSVGSLKVVDGKVSGSLRSQPTGKRTYWAVFVPDRSTMKGSTSARDGVRVR